MQERRFQNPTPKKHRRRWRIRLWQDVLVEGRVTRKQVSQDLGPATLPFREAAKRAQDIMAPLNRGSITINSSVTFEFFVKGTYIPAELPLQTKCSQQRYKGIIKNYLLPNFGTRTIAEMNIQRIQLYFSGFAKSPLSQESREKIWTVLSSIMKACIKYGAVTVNPCHGVRLPPAPAGVAVKPHINERQFDQLVELMQEPYASMVFVACWTGLRISELIGLRWGDVGEDSLTIDEKCCRGEWGAPKSRASNVTIAVLPDVISRLHRLKTLTAQIGGGRGGYQTFKIVKADGSKDLVFQSIRRGVAMRDNNILSRHIKPAGKQLGIPFVNWRCLRTSFATLLKERGVHVRDAQALMRHSRASTTMDIYQQTTDDHQRQALLRVSSSMVN